MIIMKNLAKALCLVLCIGCNSDISESPKATTSQFGAHYYVPDYPGFPKIIGDSLFAYVAYSCCTGHHPFHFQYKILHDSNELQKRRRSKVAEVWFFKEELGKICDGFCSELQAVRLPPDIAA